MVPHASANASRCTTNTIAPQQLTQQPRRPLSNSQQQIPFHRPPLSISTRRQRQQHLLCRARPSQKKDEGTTQSSSSSIFTISPELSEAADTPLLRIYIPTALVLSGLMLLDAAYSGDWVRIGALTTDQELQLQGIVQWITPIAIVGHSGLAVAAGVISARRGEVWAPRAFKTLIAGFVGLVEVVLVPEDRIKV